MSENTDEKLKPCPFCGGKAHSLTSNGSFLVECSVCLTDFLNGPVGIGWYHSEKDAAAGWNDRPSERALIAQLEAAQGNIKELESKVNHYVAAEYAHKHFDQTPDIIKRADSAELELVKVKAELLAAQKELGDLHNQEFQQRLANAEHQLYMKDLAIHNIKASRKAQFRKRLAAEAELSAANAKPKPISFDELADRVQFVTGSIRMSFDPLNCKGHQIVPFMNFNSLLRIVEMYRTTETYHLAGFTVEGGEL
ncbi:Lar family restriction alleviation protein [Yersinia enterocolitica]